MIVIPMAGLSSRFTKAGYSQPKYMLPLNGKSVFTHSVGSFSSYFDTTPFVFVARNVADTERFILSETAKLGIKQVKIIILDHETAGQAETVEIGIRQAGLGESTPVAIFNIDTFRQNFRFPETSWFATSDGYLEVFNGEGSNWSYVEPAKGTNEPLVQRTTEKQPISDLCCNGLYYFASSANFLSALFAERQAPTLGELYVAPLYNHLIRQGRKVHYEKIPLEMITMCGVPAEYESLLNK